MLTTPNSPDFKQLGQKLTNNSKEALLQSAALAKKFGYREITAGHLLYAIFLRKGSVGGNILADLGLKKEIFQRTLADGAPASPRADSQTVVLSRNLKDIFTKAFAAAREFGYPYVGTEHLAYVLLGSDDPQIKRLLADPAIRGKNQKIKHSLKSLMEPDILSNLSKMFNLPELEAAKPKSTKSSATPFIDKFCFNINSEARRGGEVIVGREKEIARMINILGRKNKNNPLLVGDPGVGKTALVTGLAQLQNTGEVPPFLYRRKIMSLDVAQLIAGTSFRGEFESRLKEIIKEAKDSKNIILFIDEIHNIVGAGNVAGSLDLANIIKPALARGEMQVIGATTQAEYKKYIEKDAALERRFQPIQVKEPNEAEAKKILFGIKGHYEAFHNVNISDAAVELAVDLSIRYVQNRFLPDKAIDILDETASDVRSKNNPPWRIDFIRAVRQLEDEKIKILAEKEQLVTEENFEKAIGLRTQEKALDEKLKLLQKKQHAAEQANQANIQAEDILETIARISGIPIEKLGQMKNKKIKDIKKVLAAQIIGQPEIVAKISDTLLRSQAGISDPDRPLGSFLFLGPTGVGKTLSAKILAKEFFGSPKSLIRIDMSELMERHSVSTLIGSPAGYVGYGEGGNLTEKVRQNPYAVVLFDEIEKAHPDVFNILLQILEDGVLTDAEGTAVSFKNTIVILTSNAGTDEFTNATRVGFADEKSGTVAEKFNEIKEQTVKELERKMRPELLNRLDHILVFSSLDRKEIQKIAGLELDKLKARTKKQGVNLALDKKIANLIAEKSLAFNQGARLVRKNIQELIENPLAEAIIYDKVKNGRITVTVEKGEIKLA